MEAPKTMEERVVVLETTCKDCRELQKERWDGVKDAIAKGDKENMKSIERMRNRYSAGNLAIGVVVITTLGNIIVVLVNIFSKR